MKKMRKLISLCVAASFAMAGMCLPAEAADSWETRTNDVDLRVGVIADTHVTATSNGSAFRNVVEAL